MNVVLSALIVILLLYPGIAFRTVYFRGRHLDGVYRLRVNVLRQPIWEQVTTSLIPALFIHLICTQLTTGFLLAFDYQIDYEFLYTFLKNDTLPSVNLNYYFVEFCGYLLFAFTTAFALGAYARTYVSDRRLDTKNTLLRFSNEWFYWLTGRILESDDSHKDRSIDLIAIYALAETKDSTIIYNGFLYDFVLTDTNNSLDRIVLFNASKSVYRKTSQSEKKAIKVSDESTQELMSQQDSFERLEKREISQEYLVIPYAQIRNMTITYIDLQQTMVDEQRI